MTKTMTVNELKNLMNLSGWTHEQEIDISNEYDGLVEGIAEVASRHSNMPFEIHFNESFQYNAEKNELKTRRDDSLYGIWWFVPDMTIVDEEGEEINSLELDEQGFKAEFSKVDYSKLIENAKEDEEWLKENL